MTCALCGLKALTIHNRCATCAPALHAAWDAVNKEIDRVGLAWQRVSGSEPLASWYEYEIWLSDGAGAELARLLGIYSAAVEGLTP